MERMIYTTVEGRKDCAYGTCPKFVVDDNKQTVSLIDRKGNRASMTTAEFNQVVMTFRNSEIEKLALLMRK